MSKLHITLVGGQPMPVYLGIKYCNPDKILFVYSKESEKQKQAIKKEVVANKIVGENAILKSDPLDPVDMKEIELILNKYKEKFANDEISINISGGTKLWAYFFAKEFENFPNSKIIYVDQNNEVYNLKEKKHEKVPFELMTQFKLNKNPLQHFTKYADYTAEDIEVIKEIERIRSINIGAFTELTNLDRQKEDKLKKQPHGVFKKEDASIEWDKSGKCVVALKKKGEIIETEFFSQNLIKIIFNAAWFELKVAHILSQWPKTREIFMNCKFLADTKDKFSKNAEEHPKNEIDIIVDTGDKALFVECKTNIKNSTDIDKFNSVVKTIGGNGSKALFVCLNNIGQKEREKFRGYDMLSYSFAESNNDIEELYSMLNRKIENINK